MSTATDVAPQADLTLAQREALMERDRDDFVGMLDDPRAEGMTRFWGHVRAIRDARQYLETHTTFAAYCRERWSLSPRHVNRLLAHDAIRDQLVPAPTSESQARPLASLPGPERADAWAEAVDRSGGEVPTAKTVAAVVAEKKGQSRVNGVLQDDPEDVARQRRNGRIPEGAVVDVTLPEAAAEESEDEPAPMSDDEWLATLPLRDGLTGRQKQTFEADALAYRQMEAARRAYKHALSRLPKPRKRGPWRWSQDMAMSKEDPSRWIACPAPEHGGCGGAGIMPLGPCVKCRGNGFIIP